MTALPHIGAMQFYSESLRDSYGFAKQFAGEDGHIATLPELITARAQTPMDSVAWSNYYTTASSEYFGTSRGGTDIVIVAHGNGPLCDITSIKAAYKTGKRRFGDGTISNKIFRGLENGDYGPVEIIDFKKVRKTYANPWFTYVTLEQAGNDPLLKARLGASWRTVIETLEVETLRDYGVGINIPTIISDGLFGYWNSTHRPSKPYAHLLSMSRVCTMHAEGRVFISFDVKPHANTDSTRFVGVRKDASPVDIHRGPEILHEQIEKLTLPCIRDTPLPRMMALKEFPGGWFSCTPKEGEAVDTGWPEHPVTQMKTVEPASKLRVPRSHFLKYDIAEIIWGAPQEANAYYLSDVQQVTHNDLAALEATVHYCVATVDETRKCITQGELKGDFDLQMFLLERLECKRS